MEKIVIISPYTKSLINFRGELIKDIVNLGYEVIALGPDDGFEKEIEKLGAKFLNYYLKRTALNPLRELKSILSLIKILRKLKPSIVFSYAIKPTIYGSLAGRISGIPNMYSMITGLGYTFTGKSLQHKILQTLLKFLFKISLKLNHVIFFQNPDDLKYFQKIKLISGNVKTEVVNGSGVDLNKYYYTNPILKPVSFLLIARLIWDKGIGEYIGAARILKDKYPEVEFKLLGPFDSNPAAVKKSDINEWITEGFITYLGKTNDVRPYISNCSVCVLPSYYREGTPRSVLEAMSMGKPIITTNTPGCKETVVEGVNGFFVATKNSIELANAMEKFVVKPNIIAKMGKKSREIAEKKYDVRKVNKVILKAMNLG